MVYSEKHQQANDLPIDSADQNADGEESVEVTMSGVETPASGNPSITRRLTEVLLEDSDEDLLLRRGDSGDGFLQWLRALDMQMIGACRADERLKPLLKLNVSNGVAEDRLLAHLSQHFEPSEVGLLARCLCVPLVSIRVGKIDKKGKLLVPTSIRGNLCLMLLPTSDLRISFNGDDGSVERLATLSSEAQCSAIDILEIPADRSGRSFLIKSMDNVIFYFWCSERSQLLGDELLRKMKDMIATKSSLAELSGISESRLNIFATDLRAYLTESSVTSNNANGVLSTRPPLDNSTGSSEFDSSESSAKYHGSLSSIPSSFEDCHMKKTSSVRIAPTENFRKHGDNHVQSVDGFSLAPSNSTSLFNSNCFKEDTLPDPFAMLNFVEVLSKAPEHPLSSPKIQICPSGSSHFSPHYCWCPPIVSKPQYSLENSPPPPSTTESFSLPPLSSLLPATRSFSVLTSKQSVNLAEVPPTDFPSFLPDPVIRMSASNQIPTFIPLICDPIVHIPMIDVCSSGPGYLVSAGAMIPPVKTNLVDPFLPTAESVVEKSARETLRMLISSSNTGNSKLLDVLSSVSYSSDSKQNIPATGSRGLYTGIRDVLPAITSGVANVVLVTPSVKSSNCGIGRTNSTHDDSLDKMEKPSSSSSSGYDSGMD